MLSLRSFLSSPNGRTFATVWVGQFASNFGSSLTQFGLAIWVFQETGSVTQLALIIVASRVPAMLMSPFAGALVDRWDRRWAMILADGGAALGTMITMILLLSGRFEIWHLYLTMSLSGVFGSFQFPAYSATVTHLIDKEHYARAAGLVQLAGSVGQIAAPTIAAAVVVWQGLTPLFLIDFATFLVAVGTLLFVRFPKAEPSERRGRGVVGLLREAREGLDFLLERRALLILLVSFLMVNFAFAFQGVLFWPLLLNIASEQTAGFVVSAGAIGLVAGSVVLSIWGGPKNRILGVYVPISAMAAGMILQGVRPSLWLVLVGLILVQGTHPIAAGSSQAIWQSKVPANLQGRVFAIRQVAALGAMPVAFLVAGVLADRVFEPFMETPPDILQNIFGAGPGRGIGLMFVIGGVMAAMIAIWALRHPRIRNLETEIPDHVSSETPRSKVGSD